MSAMLDNILTRNFQNLALDDAFLPPQQPQLKAPGSSRLNRSVSFFSSPSATSSSSSRHISLSTEHVNDDDGDDDNNGSFWPADIWSQAAALSRPQLPLHRPDRSMSLTESSSAALLLSCLKDLESSSSCSGGGVAPPPGFPPLSSSSSSCSLTNQVPPVLLPSNRYKTELCRGFQESGSCKYGTKCQFAHGEDELRGLFRHPKYKTEHCRTFYNFGYCPYGTRCHFIHEEKASGIVSLGGGGKFQNQQQLARQTSVACGATGHQNPRHQLRQSVSFAGFLGASRNSPPPSFNDPNLGFSRAPSVSPPPADLLSPVFGVGDGGVQREAAAMAFQFGHHHHHRHQQQQQQRTRASTGDIHAIPLIVEPSSSKPSRCVCGGHGNAGYPTTLNPSGGNSGRAFPAVELDGHHHQELSGLFASANSASRGGFMSKHGGAPGLQRFSSEDSLEDSYSSSSGGSSGTESPTFDGSAGKRLTVFARLSLSD